MATRKDLFDDEKKEKLLKEAIKKVKQKKGAESFPFGFGIGQAGAMIVLDWKRQNDPNKLFLEMKKNADKVIVGEAKIMGDLIEIEVKEEKGGKIKPIEVKKCLAKTPLKKCKLTSKEGNKGKDHDPNG
jgi:hypothetical protein